jgi:hypothetical protein
VPALSAPFSVIFDCNRFGKDPKSHDYVKGLAIAVCARAFQTKYENTQYQEGIRGGWPHRAAPTKTMQKAVVQKWRLPLEKW